MILVIGMKASLFAKWQTFENRLQYVCMGPCEYVSRADGHDVDSIRAESNFTVL